MILIPALELLAGQVVHLPRNDRDNPIVLAEDPVAAAEKLMQDGAKFFHLTDLDAAFDRGNNDDVLRKFADKMLPFQVGGGIRTAERADELLWSGADAVVMGALFYSQPDVAKHLVDQYGNRVLAALDLLDGKISRNIRSEATDHDLDRALDLLAETGVHNVIYHKVSVNESDIGPDIAGLKRILENGSFGVHAHCSIQEKDELLDLIDLIDHGLAGAVVTQTTAAHSLNLEKALRVLS